MEDNKDLMVTENEELEPVEETEEVQGNFGAGVVLLRWVLTPLSRKESQHGKRTNRKSLRLRRQTRR